MVLPLNCTPPLVALAAVRSKEEVLLLLIHCLLLPHCFFVFFWGGGSVFYACFFLSITLCHPSFVISLVEKRKLVALL